LQHFSLSPCLCMILSSCHLINASGDTEYEYIVNSFPTIRVVYLWLVRDDGGAMLRPATIAIYSVVFGVALLAGLLIAVVLLPQSLPAAGITTPTAAIEPIASISELVVVAPGTTPERPSVTTLPPTAKPTALPTSTPQPSPTATELFFPTITPSIAPTPTPEVATAAPEPLAFIARIVEQPSDAAVSCGTAFESRIWGVVKARNGGGLYRAVVEVRSADGKHRFSAQTNDQRGFELPGLGCTTWILRLVGVPRAPAGVQATELRVKLNGGRYSGAGVEFRQR
jgi:hypothetical protein